VTAQLALVLVPGRAVAGRRGCASRASGAAVGEDSIGLPGIGEWQALLGSARQHGELLAIEPRHYPRHFRALFGFHRELSRLPRIPDLPRLGWDAAHQYLVTHAVP
jgi:hypothetical protein